MPWTGRRTRKTMADPDPVLDPDLVARPGRRAGAAKLRCSGRRQHRGHFFLSCLTRTLDGPGPPVTALATSSGVHCGPQPGKRRARLAPWRPEPWTASATDGARSCATPADARVAMLVCLATTEKPKNGFTAASSPPIPPTGGFERPSLTRPAGEHNAGDYAGASRTLAPGRRPQGRVAR